MNFSLEPYVGARPYAFGMSEEDILSQGVEPRNRRVNFRGEVDLRFGDFSMRLSADHNRLCEIEFDQDCQVSLSDIDVFGDERSLEKLVSLDSRIYEYVGILVFFDLGISLSGFHRQADGGRGLSMFSKGYWDEKLDNPKFKVWTE